MNDQREDDLRLRSAARAVAAGLPLNWPSLESDAPDDSARRVLRQLRVLSEIVDLHRDSGASATGTESVWDSVSTPSPPDATDVHDDLLPHLPTWGPLTLLDRVGAGAFGEVYRAWDSRLDREVALKLLRAPATGGDRVGRAVIDEGRMLARVRHPHVVTVYGAERAPDGRVGVWMEFVRGRTLEQVLDQNGPLSSREATLVGLDLCRALSAVHHAGLIHRDVKAQNVVREDGGRIVLMDFGNGAFADAGSVDLAGTPLYVAPELLRSAPATAASDLYSLGVLLYHLVTGSYPIAGRSLEDIRAAHLAGRYELLRDARPDLPTRFVAVVERALASDAAARFESAGAMERALNEMLPEPGRLDHVPQADAGDARQPANARTRRLAIAGASLAATVVAAVVLAGPAKSLWTGSRALEPASTGGGGKTGAAITGPMTRKVAGLTEWMHLGRPSVDGRAMTYVDMNGDLGLLDTIDGTTRRLTNKGQSAEGGDMSSVMSVDGTQIAYAWRALDGKYEFRLVGADGKWPRVLLRPADDSTPHPIQWSRDGEHILTLVERPNGTNQLGLVAVADGRFSVIKDLGYVWPQNATLSPDGRYVAYDAPQRSGAVGRDVYITSTDGAGTSAPLVSHESNDVFPIWTAAGDTMIFFSDRTGSLGMWEQPLAGAVPAGPARVIDKDLGRVIPIGMTDQGALYYMKPTGMVDVFTLDLSDLGNPAGAKVVSPSAMGANISSCFSADGKYLAYVAMRGVVSNDRYSRVLVIKHLETGEQRDLLPALSFFIAPRWSADGRSILVQGKDFSQRGGWHVVDAQSGATRQVLADQRLGNAIWSHDGTAILYLKNLAIVSHTLSTGQEAVLVDVTREGTLGGGAMPTFAVSPDGGALAYRLFRDDPKAGVHTMTLRVSVFGGATRDLMTVSRPEMAEIQDWSADGQDLLFTRFTQKGPADRSLWRISIHGGDPQPMGLTMPGLRDLHVQPDGRLLTFTSGRGSYELWSASHLQSPR